MKMKINIYKFEHKNTGVRYYYAAESLESAKGEFESDTGETEGFFREIEYSIILKSELKTRQILKDEKESESFQTALEQLISEGAEFPRAFASSEW